MTTAYSDILAPRELIIPRLSGTATQQPTTLSGALFISGALLYVVTESTLLCLSGANIL